MRAMDYANLPTKTIGALLRAGHTGTVLYCQRVWRESGEDPSRAMRALGISRQGFYDWKPLFLTPLKKRVKKA